MSIFLPFARRPVRALKTGPTGRQRLRVESLEPREVIARARGMQVIGIHRDADIQGTLDSYTASLTNTTFGDPGPQDAQLNGSGYAPYSDSQHLIDNFERFIQIT